jgi:hypothetical protein
MPTTDDAITVTRRRDGNPATVYPGITTDLDVEERRQSIATEKRCDNQLRTNSNDDICGGGERIKAAGTVTATATVMATAIIGWLVVSHQVAAEMRFCCGELLGNRRI